MDVTTHATLWGRRILVAEDSYLLAAHVSDILEDAGVKVIGPVPGVGDAVRLILTAA
jgi:hypothetical protein